MEVVEEDGTVSFPAASPEFSHATPWTEEEKPEWMTTPWTEKPEGNESCDEWVKRYWGKYPPIVSDEIEAKWQKWKEQMKEGLQEQVKEGVQEQVNENKAGV